MMQINGLPLSKYNVVYFLRSSNAERNSSSKLKAFIDRKEKNVILLSGNKPELKL
jgi:hypothetical protein